MKKIIYLYISIEIYNELKLDTILNDNVEIIHCNKLLDIEEISKLNKNYLITFGISTIIPERIFREFNQAINIHAASPEYPGRDPHHYAIYDKATVYGAVAHYMEKLVDSGLIIEHELFDVPKDITPLDLLQLANQAGKKVLKTVIRKINDSINFTATELQWQGKKRARKDLFDTTKIKPYDKFDNVYEKYQAFQRGINARNLSIELYGLKFTYDSGSLLIDDNIFNYEYYESIIKKVKSEYKFIGLDEIEHKNSNMVIWRHDVDFSVCKSLELARIESKQDVKSTYFIMLNSPYYSTRDNKTRRQIKEIKKLGHDIGLHYDATYLKWSSVHDHSEFEESLLSQKLELEKIIEMPIKSYTIHDPTNLCPTLFCSINRCTVHHNMTNLYANSIREKFHYVSDSNGIWKYGDLESFINSKTYSNLHILTHPVWWSKYSTTPRTKILNELLSRVSYLMDNYDMVLDSQGRINY